MKTRDKVFFSIGSAAIVAATGFGSYALFIDPKTAIKTTASVESTNQPAAQTNSNTSDTEDDLAQEESADNSTTTTPVTNNTATPTVPTATTPSTTTTGGYKDGTYTASANYSVPHGQQNTINVTLTVAGGVITAVSTTNTYSDNESGMYVDSFKSGLSAKVVGTSISGASFSRIGGASLTTAGFQTALDTIIKNAAV